MAPNLPDNESVLSVYLETDASTGLWNDKKERLRSALDACQAGVADKKDRALFDTAREWVEQYAELHHSHGKGLAMFYAPKTGQSWSTSVQEPVRNQARFQIDTGDAARALGRAAVARRAYEAALRLGDQRAAARLSALSGEPLPER